MQSFYRPLITALLLALIFISSPAHADDLTIGDKAPDFTLPNQSGQPFSLSSRAQKGWTVLYFYPKSETPGCTKQACAFRDAIDKIRAHGAEVYGISADSVEAQAGFHEHHHLKFDLLADPEAKVITLYGAKVPALSLAKRWTFILDPELRIRAIERDVDPAYDATRVAEELVSLQGATK